MSSATAGEKPANAEKGRIDTMLLRRMLNVDGLGVLIFDGSGTLVEANDAFLTMSGYGREEVDARVLTWRVLTPPEHMEETERQMRLLGETGRIGPYEKEYFCKDGTRSWMVFSGTSLGDGTFVKYCVDIDDHMRVEEALRQSEHRLRLALDAAFTLAFEWDIPRNQVWRHRSGVGAIPETSAYRPSSLEEFCAAIHPGDRERFLANLHAALAHPERSYEVEFRVCEADGRIVWLDDHGYFECDAQGKPLRLIGLSQDITRRKRAEEAARAAEELARQRLSELEDLYAHAPVGLCLLDRDLRYLRVNERLAEFNGTAALEHLGKTVSQVLPELAGTIEPGYREVIETGQARLGNEVVGETRASPGVERTWLEHSLPVKDAAGRVVGVSIVVEEITERKRAEAALEEADRRKDNFLATLAHELRNPLAPIRTGLDLFRVVRGNAAACEEPLRIMDRQLNHLVRLVDDLLDVSRISRGKIELRKERIDLAEIIHRALEMNESGLRKGDRRLTAHVASEPLVVEGDRVRLVQIVANLLNNAAKFTEAGGQIDVRVTPKDGWVEIQVKDDGRGIPRDRLEGIFKMFSQVEPGHASGLGIGLSLVRGLVEMHGGSVRADSNGPGHGATFTVSLPLCQSVPAQPWAETTTELGALPSQLHVLLVDDNPDIAKGMHLLLTMLGAEVRVAHDGAEAIRIFDEWLPTHVLMDLGMPRMDGYEAARRLRATHPDRSFRLIAVTGWGQEEDRQRTWEAGFDEHLVKPVRIETLTRVLSI